MVYLFYFISLFSSRYGWAALEQPKPVNPWQCWVKKNLFWPQQQHKSSTRSWNYFFVNTNFYYYAFSWKSPFITKKICIIIIIVKLKIQNAFSSPPAPSEYHHLQLRKKNCCRFSTETKKNVKTNVEKKYMYLKKWWSAVPILK